MKLQYQKSAARRGFQAEQVSRANVQQILNQGKQQADAVRAYGESDIRERNRQSQLMEENYQFEAKQAAENYDILQRNLATKVERAVTGGEIAAKQQAAMFDSFASLSKTAAVGYQEYTKKQDAITKQNDINKYFYDAEYRQKVDAAMEGMTIENSAVEIETNAERDAAEAVSINKVPVAEFSQRANRLSIGQRIAYVQGQAGEYPGYIAKQLANPDQKIEINGQAYQVRDILDNQELYNEYLTTTLRPKFLEEKGLMGLSLEAMSPGLQSMRTVENQLVTSVGNAQIRKIKSNILASAEGKLNTLKGSALQAQFPAIIQDMNYANDYNSLRTRKQLVELLKANDSAGQPLIPENSTEYNIITSTPILKGPDGKTFALKDYRGDMEEIKTARARALNNAWQLENATLQRETEQYWALPGADGTSPASRFNAEADRINQDPSLTPDQRDLKLQQLVTTAEKQFRDLTPAGYDVRPPANFTTTTRALLDDSREAKEAYQDERIQQGEVDYALIDNEPDPERRKVLEEALKVQEEKKYGPEYVAVKKSLADKAQALTGQYPGGKFDPKYKSQYAPLVERALLEDFRVKFQEIRATGTKTDAQAAVDAGAYIDGLVSAGLGGKASGGVGAGDPNAKYYRNFNTARGVVDFPNLNLKGRPRLTGKDLNDFAKDWTTKIQQSESLLSGAQLREQSDNFYVDGTFVTPQAVSDLRKKIKAFKDANPNSPLTVPTAQELVNAQIEAYNKTLPKDAQIRLLRPNAAEQELGKPSEAAIEIFSDWRNLSTVRTSRAFATSPGGEYLVQSSGRLPESGFEGEDLTGLQLSSKEQWATLNPDERAATLANQLSTLKYNGFPAPGQPNRVVFTSAYNSSKSLQNLNLFFGEHAFTLGVKDVLYGTPGHMDSLTVIFE